MSQLVAYRSTVVTPDTAEALRLLERAGAELGNVRIKYRGVKHAQATWKGVEEDPGPLGLSADFSMRPTGREIYLGLEVKGDPVSKEQELALLWSLVIPLGFLPWSRYPVQGALDNVFHFLGPWAVVGDFLQGEGRGELAWPSMCAAAQCAAGLWAGPRLTERTIQMHLHRLGIHCGPVDGLLGERTLSSLRALGLGGVSSQELVGALAQMKTLPQRAAAGPQTGYFTMKSSAYNVEPFCSGKVQASRTHAGLAVSVDGPGRLILLFGGHEQ